MGQESTLKLATSELALLKVNVEFWCAKSKSIKEVK